MKVTRYHLLLACFLALGCNRLTLSSGGDVNSQKQTEGDIARQNPEESRPSEEGEGVPGYLVDPSLVKILKSGSSILISAPEGTIKTVNTGDDPRKVVVDILRLDDLTANSITKVNEDLYRIEGKLLDSVVPEGDGSFTKQILSANDNPIVIRISGSGNTILVASESQRAIVIYKDVTNNEAATELNIVLLKREYPEVINPEAAEDGAALTTQIDCNNNLYYWNHRRQVCVTTIELAKLENCWPDRDASALYEIIRSSTGEESDAREDFVDFMAANLILDQCYYEDELRRTIIIEFLVPNGVNYDDDRRTEVSARALESFITP